MAGLEATETGNEFSQPTLEFTSLRPAYHHAVRPLMRAANRFIITVYYLLLTIEPWSANVKREKTTAEQNMLPTCQTGPNSDQE